MKKTKYLIFHRQNLQEDHEFKISGKVIERETEARYLGVIVDDKLTWSTHISTVKTKMARYIGIMYKLKGQYTHFSKHGPVSLKLLFTSLGVLGKV